MEIKMKIEQFTEWSFVHSPQSNKNSDSVIFQVSKPNLEKNNYETNLWTYNKNNLELSKLTNSNQDSSVIFLENGDLLFSSGRPDKITKDSDQKNSANSTKFWRINPSGGEAEFEFAIDLSVNKILELDTDKYLIHGFKNLDHTLDWVEINDLPFWYNGAGYTSGIWSGLYIFDAKSAKKHAKSELKSAAAKQLNKAIQSTLGESENNTINSDSEDGRKNQPESNFLKLITSNEETVNGFELSPDKKTVIYYSTPLEKVSLLKENLTILDLESLESQTISKQEFQIYSVNFPEENNNQAFVIAASDEKIGLNQNPDIYLLNLANKTLNLISPPDFDTSIGSSVGTDARFGGGQSICTNGSELYFISTVRDKAVLKKINQQGQVSTVIEKAGSIDSFTIVDNKVYFVALLDLKLPEFYVYPLQKTDNPDDSISAMNNATNTGSGSVSNDSEISQITDFSNVLSDTNLLPIEKFQFESNGSTLDGFVIKPLNFKEDQKYPALLEIHGGPKTVYGTVLHHEMQFLASQGYFVFFTNPHGSDGHGDDFSDIRGKYGTIDYQDLMTFTDLVLEKYPAIDSQRIGCLGGSYGGFMVNWIIGHTDRFTAANSQRSISNWLSFYGVSDIGYYFTQDQTASNPWDNALDAWGQSPLKYANNAKTPTLFIHSDQDYRCPLEQGIQMYAALQVNQVDTKLVVFKNETHELSRSGKPLARIKRLSEISDWFKNFLKP